MSENAEKNSSDGQGRTLVVGMPVKVRQGVKDPNYPDFSLEGLTGVVAQIDPEHEPPLALVRWDEQTLRSLPADFQERCENDDLDAECIWLEEKELEPTGTQLVPVPLPGISIPEPVEDEDPEFRISSIFGLPSGAPLPQVDGEHLRIYHAFLSETLRFPFEGVRLSVNEGMPGEVTPLTVLRLASFDPSDVQDGLQVEVEIEGEMRIIPLHEVGLVEDSPAQREIQDYQYWVLFNHPAIRDRTVLGLDPALFERPRLLPLLARFGVYGAGCGASLGAILAVVDSAVTGMLVGGGILGFLGFMLGSRARLSSVPRLPIWSAGGGLLGLVLGGVVGGILGILAVAILGTLTGAMVGSILGKLVGMFELRPLGEMGWSLLGAFAGGLILAWYRNQAAALAGARVGALTGGLVTVLVMLAVLSTIIYMISGQVGRRNDDEGS